MKLIAHRGGTFGKENSLETIIASARMGADAVECDIRKTVDGVYVIYHDSSLERLSGQNKKVSETEFSEMKRIFEENGHGVITFEDLKNGYREKTPILLHIKLEEYDEEFAEYIAKSGLPIIAGVVSTDMLRCFSKYLPRERILAFMPNWNLAEEYYAGGAGIIRLWEQWLDRITPEEVKKACPGAEVFIMACNRTDEPNEITTTLESMNGSRESLDRCRALGADGVLLNDIEMAISHRKSWNK